MIKTILVPIEGASTDRPALEAALSVAQRFEAQITALHVRPDVEAAVASMMGSANAAGNWVGDMAVQMRAEAEAAEQRALASFHAFCGDFAVRVAESEREAGLCIRWLACVGALPARLAELGRLHDLTIVLRGQGAQTGWLAVLEAAVIESGRPVLIVPPAGGPVQAETIAVAWKSSAEAARAVAAAVPFFGVARRVAVLTIGEKGDLEAADREAESLARALRHHHGQVEARAVRPNGDAAGALFAAAGESGAGMLVMGGYSHSRWRELVLGGFTKRALREAPLPVLVSH